MSNPLNRIHNAFTAQLPLELVDTLNQAYFLHLLATDPGKVIPPGKSLLSMMARSSHMSGDGSVESGTSILHDRVEKVVHQAFWTEALESLSSPLPSDQLFRLKGLYSDLRDALKPLLPPTHPILHTLSSPLPPTSSPLRSTLVLSKEILTALRQRCAPVRDADIDVVLSRLNEVPPPLTAFSSTLNSPGSSSGSSSPIDHAHHLASPLAHLTIDIIKSIISVSETMKSDLNQVVVGSMTEAQLKAVIIQQAKARERELVLDIWGDAEEDGREKIREGWWKWIAGLENPQPNHDDKEGSLQKWIARLVQSLGSPTPVSCNMYTPPSSAPIENGTAHPPPNELPPQFFFTTPSLLYIQNYLQALVVAASLCSLIRLPPPSPYTEGERLPGSDFMQRIWTLLKVEIDDDDETAHRGPETAGATKLINLADEVIRARRLSSPTSTLDSEEEDRLRSAVERTLRPQDPVFLLLQKRLIGALATMAHVRHPAIGVTSSAIPVRMQTGKNHMEGERSRKRLGMLLDFKVENGDGNGGPRSISGHGPSTVKGFEDPVLIVGLDEIAARLAGCIAWVQEVWGDLS